MVSSEVIQLIGNISGHLLYASISNRKYFPSMSFKINMVTKRDPGQEESFLGISLLSAILYSYQQSLLIACPCLANRHSCTPKRSYETIQSMKQSHVPPKRYNHPLWTMIISDGEKVKKSFFQTCLKPLCTVGENHLLQQWIRSCGLLNHLRGDRQCSYSSCKHWNNFWFHRHCSNNGVFR